MENYVKVDWEGCWADEMDLEGFVVMPKEYWGKIVTKAKSIDQEFSLSVGTNEEINYTNGQDWLDNIKIKEVSKEDYEVFKKHFEVTRKGYIHFGVDFMYIIQDFEDYYYE